MVGLGSNRGEFVGSQCQDQFLNLKRRRDRKVSVHTAHTSRSQSQGGSHVSHEVNTRSMQLEIDRLRRRLRRDRRRRPPSNSDFSSNNDGDGSYRPRSRTPPSESFSCDEDHHHEHGHKSLPCKGLGNDFMSKTLNQISKSPFTRRIEGRKLSWRFTQPIFTMYNGRTDPIKYVSYFNQRMVVHSKNKTLMCKVFPSSLGLWQWNGLMVWEQVLLVPLRNSLGCSDLVLLLTVEFLGLWTLCCP